MRSKREPTRQRPRLLPPTTSTRTVLRFSTYTPLFYIVEYPYPKKRQKPSNEEEYELSRYKPVLRTVLEV